MKKQLLIAGGSGLIGSAIAAFARNSNWEVTLLSRSGGVGRIQWNPTNHEIALPEPMEFDAIINLAGASIAGNRWTKKRKKLILDSRLQSCATLEKYLESGLLKTQTYIGASAVGIYGHHTTEIVDEHSVTDHDDWLAMIAQEWEKAHNKIARLGIRTIIVRIGLVLSREGGALKEIIQTAPFGFLGCFGSGSQFWSWIHIDDVAQLMLHVLSNKETEGVYLATAPFPATNQRITEEISKTYSPSRFVIPVPTFVLSLMLGEMHTMLMQSCRCYPERLIGAGFQFKYLKIEKALQDLMSKEKLNSKRT